jgi:hypothetical protein
VIKPCTLTKVRAGANASSISDSTLALNTGTSYVDFSDGGPLTLGVGPGGTVHASVSHTYEVSSSDFRLSGKFQYRTTPGSGSWTDFGTEATGLFASPGEPGSLDFSRTMSGPGTATNWEFRYLSRKSGGTASSTSAQSGEFAVWNSA